MGNPKRPININKETCSPVSSNCVIWQGPNIPCLNLCKGATVTEVVYELATKFCNLYAQFDPESYNYDCLNIDGCPPETFQDLFQTLINRVCDLLNAQEPNTDCCDTFIPRTAYYATNRLGGIGSGVVTDMTYTIPAGGQGVYEVDFTADAVITSGEGLEVNVFKNGVAVDTIARKTAQVSVSDPEAEITFPVRLFVSEIPATVGDTIDVRLVTSSASDAFLNFGVVKILKIG